MKDDARQILEIDLVDNASVRRDDFEIPKCRLSPAQEPIAFDVALELNLVVRRQGVRGAVLVDLHRVVNYELRGREWVDSLRIAAQLDDRLAHRGQIYDARYAREVLQDDARGRKGDLMRGGGARIPGEQCLNVTLLDVDAVFEAQEILKENFQ